MGKTEKGALWLDPEKTTPYEFYQYWRNVDDADVEKCLGLLTFLPMDEVRRLGALEGSEINEAKKVLAFEVTKLVHGKEEASEGRSCRQRPVRRRRDGRQRAHDRNCTAEQLAADGRLTTILTAVGIAKSNSAARKLVEQNAVSINDAKVTDVNYALRAEDIPADGLMIRSGKQTITASC